MNKDLKEAIEMFEKIEKNPEMKALYDAYFKQVTDEANRLETAREEERQLLAEERKALGIREENWTKKKKALEQIEENLSYDHFKQVTDEENRLETARQEGKLEERKAITRKLLKSGSTLEQIEEILGFDPKKYL